ncbi:uncharacterized protein LOC109503859 [Harpegnathos saltator]|uniref:uncharacterized protein LOC109503859 n=1 Tax=Harpegnathos saltator TaxID=610380 RepID=UPI000DBEEA6F|nr:uncharacterized protein LOC109503859 [Harpegnathos saltator]
MINIEDQYFSYNKYFLLALGLWPYWQTRLAYIQYIFLLGFLSTAIIFHFTTFITAKCTVYLVIKVLSSAFLFIDIMVQYFSFHTNNVTVKVLLEELQRICDEIKDNNELAIIRRYGNVSRCYAMWFMVSIFCLNLILILVSSWPSILDFVQPRNESRLRNLLFPMEYFVDQHRYYYLILLYQNTIICIGTVALLSTGSLFFSFQKYICGMFTIASYRIKQSIKSDTTQKTKLQCRNPIAEIVSAVEIHRRAMKFSKHMVNEFEVMLCILVATGVCSLSLNLFQIFLIISSEYNINELFLPTGAAMIIAVYMFLANYIGQDLTDHNRQIFIAAYNICWYKTPLNVQRLILFLLQRGVKDFMVSIGGLINASLECFAMMANVSVSYFSVLYSTQG